jgi:Asp-tRNA(Asn)/Glu-tRNA(Gln) amidotransferase A subunit family amidase
MSLLDRSARDLAAELQSGGLTAVALTASCLDRIAAQEPDIHAWAYVDPEAALAQARAADARRAAGESLGALHGLPVGVKDIIDTADMPTEYNSPIHRGRRPQADATLVARLRSAGAIILGKTVTSEFAVYTPGPTRNPHDLARTPGGSSSGSAAAVAAGMIPLALATQTNGSTIRPASFCGIVGYKPSLGLLPRTGILKQSTMLDQPGVMARSAGDAAFIARALMGVDPLDEQSLAATLCSPPTAAATDSPPRLAFVRGPYWAQADAATQAAIAAFASNLGGGVATIDLPAAFDEAADVHSVIMNAGIAESYAEDHRRAKTLMSDVVRGVVEAGQRLSAVEFVAALSARERLRVRFSEITAPFDALITPAALGIAPRREAGTGNPIMSTLWTLLGAPALSLPLLQGPEGMPLGVQLVGRLGADADLIRAAAWLERRGAVGRRHS